MAGISLGGILMIPLLICSILFLCVVIERTLVLRRHRRDSEAFRAELVDYVADQDWDGLNEFCEETDLPISRIIKRGLRYRGTTASAVQRAMEEQARLEVPLLRKRIGVLSIIAHIGPLLGLLGTIFGMISAFQEIERLGATGQAVDAGLLASGIWEALITTAGGLIVAIPAYIVYRGFTSALDNQVADLELMGQMVVDELVTARPSTPDIRRNLSA